MRPAANASLLNVLRRQSGFLLAALLLAVALLSPDSAFTVPASSSASSLVSSSADWIFETDQQMAMVHYGSTAGDVNGDGFDDIIVGSAYYSGPFRQGGRVWAFHGSAAGLSLTPDWIVDGDQSGSSFGVSVATAGDVNGDGFADVIVGAPFQFSPGFGVNGGRASLFYGSAAGLLPIPSWTVDGDRQFALLGTDVASAGDVNCDGYDDLIVGAPGYPRPKDNTGQALIYHGSAAGPSSVPDQVLTGHEAGSYFGSAVASAGDVNGDGCDDVVVGAGYAGRGPNNEAGRAFLYLGSPSGVSRGAQWSPYGDQPGFPGAHFGTWVSAAGDVNGDGYGDVVVGASHYDNGEFDEGRAYVYHGSASGLERTAAWVAEGDYPQAHYGSACAVDLDADGYSDVLVGASGFNRNSGIVFVYRGSISGLSTSADKILTSPRSGSWFGSACRTAGDVNGDGFGDVVVVMAGYSNGESNEGAAFVYHGSGP